MWAKTHVLGDAIQNSIGIIIASAETISSRPWVFTHYNHKDPIPKDIDLGTLVCTTARQVHDERSNTIVIRGISCLFTGAFRKHFSIHSGSSWTSHCGPG